ncbi:hypothetical protein GCM10007928_51910 [Sulfitobacter porphyrae]|nr:hypothetical protein GCM10007928_51910 [Sulfitobacter porphyrae]
MKILCLLLLAAFASVALAKKEKCRSKDKGVIEHFNGRANEVTIPCKYNALKHQQCGPYFITLTPGNVWLGERYYLNSLWLSVEHETSGKKWDFRTTNKLALKHYRSEGSRSLFNEKTDNADDEFEYGLENGKGPTSFIQDKGGKYFKLTFDPWLSIKKKGNKMDRKVSAHANFEFQCFAEEKEDYIDYPEQICGGFNKKVLDRATEPPYNLQSNHRVTIIYYDILMSDVLQTDERCFNASNMIKNNCGDLDQQLLVLKNCMAILAKPKDTQCVTYYSCHPMDTFNACLEWGCGGFDKDHPSCHKLGEAIDLCSDITGPGNITERLRDSHCYKEFSTGKAKYHTVQD